MAGGWTQNVQLDGTNTTLSSVQMVDNTPASLSKSVSHSSGAIKAGAGTLFGWIGTTAGDIEIKDGNTSIGRFTIVASAVTSLGHWGIPFGTTISTSSSAGVAVFVYK